MTVSHLSVKQLGLKSNTVYFDSHKTLSGWRWDGEGWYEKTLFATDTIHMCSSFIFNIHKMISFSILRIKISTVKYGIRVDGTVGSGYQFRVDKWSNEL